MDRHGDFLFNLIYKAKSSPDLRMDSLTEISEPASICLG